MQHTNLMAIQEEGQKLIMMDGTIWIINPDDVENTAKWIPPCSILIKETSVNSEYDYSIANEDEDNVVSAQKRR